MPTPLIQLYTLLRLSQQDVVGPRAKHLAALGVYPVAPVPRGQPGPSRLYGEESVYGARHRSIVRIQ